MAGIENEIEKHLFAALDWLRSKHHIRKGLALVVIGLLLGLAGKFAYDLYPQHYTLSISGGGMLTKTHYLTKVLQDEAAHHNITLNIIPTTGSFQSLNELNDGRLDLAFVQGGIAPTGYADVTQVASLAPELIQYLVRPDVKSIRDIRGKTVNVGEKNGGTSIVSNQILRFSGLVPEVDYVEKNYSDEELLTMKTEKLPDVIVQVSYAPSATVDFLVQKRNYHLLEMPFPPSLAMRMGWVSDAKILAYMYRIAPAVPETDIRVVGVNLNLLANKDVSPRAISRLLYVLYSPQVSSRFGVPLSQDKMLNPSGFPISEGTSKFIASQQPLITNQMIDQIKGVFGLIMTLLSISLVIFKWFKTPEDDEPEHEDEEGGGKPGLGDHFNSITGNLSKFD
ncbi:TAXI family TRAP transporter solute-binding subunit [Polynucleobacter sp. UK-Kesae-W10]|uniref:TAXI family TRAP transporter solute-binding subunit n=1 Tax=Polynucleobacter sp. UK-Kesae-W10 TaxID=1819738 RepID=UPI001C0AC08D|nr:TAXI family TRAP transporter solute-binding subunit [Polynucleobacter sp. UK-Kesae-W10]MBU3577862.1 hypothetical protein [Polynucleobacter sp. UK-Kesae-W10]